MKQYTKLFNIINIISLVFLIIAYFIKPVTSSILIYSTFKYILFGIYCIIGVSSIITSLLNFKERNIAIGFLQLFIGLLWLTILNSNIIFITIPCLILNIIVLKLNQSNSHTSHEQKITLFIVCSIFTFIELMAFIIPTIMNQTNLKELSKTINNISIKPNIDTTVKKVENEYVFYKSSKEINRKDFDDLAIISDNKPTSLALVINGSNVNVGIAKKGNLAIIIDCRGDELFSIQGSFGNYYSTATSFINYVVENHSYGIKLANE